MYKNTPRKPHLATDVDLEKLKLPVIAMPKLDGVRGCNFTGELVGRSLKSHANLHVTTQFSKQNFAGLDGELTCGAITADDLVRVTTSALNTIEGTPDCVWNVFDLLNDETIGLPYWMRLIKLTLKVNTLNHSNIRVIPHVVCNTLEELLKVELTWLTEGYEGVIIRDPNGLHKDGRCTVKEGAYLRLKRFIEFEFKATCLVEGSTNLNPKKTNKLGKSERSSHKANKIANGMIGTIIGISLADVVCPVTGKLLISKHATVEVSAGCLTHDQRKYYFNNQQEFFNQIHKGKFFPVGMKDKLRFPTWETFRAASDMSEG